MSDLIDFDSPSLASPGETLASPLIPSPEAGPPVYTGARRSTDNNPFDMVLKKINDYERNKEDPFERVIEKAMGRVSIESKDDCLPKRSRRCSDTLKLNKTLDETQSSRLDTSLVVGVDGHGILTDLNDTNMIVDNVAAEKPSVAAWDCDNKIALELNASPLSGDSDLSILSQSAMNDSLLDDQLLKEPSASLFVHPRSMSQGNILSPENRPLFKSNRRSLSVADASTSIIHNIDSSIASVQSSLFEDPLNTAFRTTRLKSSTNSNDSCFNSQFDLSVSNQRNERLNSDSSVFSGFSNISAIPTDPFSRVRQGRFFSETSAYSNISNLSAIRNSTLPSSDSSVFVNDTMNNAFFTSRSQLSSTSSSASFKAPPKATDKSDLIRQFYKIKSNMSTSQIELKSSNSSLAHEKDNFSLKSETLPIDSSLQKIEGKLIDVGENLASVSAHETGINDIIFNEARTLAETFKKMASTNEDDLLISKTQLNFDDLLPSDDETVDNLIELSGGESEIKISSEVNTKSIIITPKDEIKALEDEFIDHKDSDKKAVAATLLLDLEKLIKDQDNPDAFKVLTDLQKMLGVGCENNTEILQKCFQNNLSPENGKELKNDTDSSISMGDKNVKSNCNELTSKTENSTKEMSENKSSNSSNDISDLNSENESKDVISDNSNSQSNFKRVQKNDDVTSEDQKLALNLLKTVKKIVSKNNEDPTVDVLKSLGAVLSMASELRAKNDDKQLSERKEIRRSQSPKPMNRSISSMYKSPAKKNLAIKKVQNASYETLPLRRSISMNRANSRNSNALVEAPCIDKRKSHFLSLNKRFSSDPGFADAADKKKVEAAVPKSTIGANKPTMEPIKTKLKKKLTSDVVSKKGPMKAIIPLGSMQKQDVKRASNEAGASTSPKTRESIPSVRIMSSTPNSSANSKSKPTASSTPNTDGLKSQRIKSPSKNSSKGTLKCSLSPVSLNSSSKTITSNKSDRRSSLTKPSTPRKNESTESVSSRLPRYSPRPARVRNHSFSEVKSSKSPQPSSGSLKVPTNEKTQRHSALISPLRNCNKLPTKAKPVSLMPRLSRSISLKSDAEKENYA